MDNRTRSISAVFVLTGAVGLVMSTTDRRAPRCAAARTPVGRMIRVELASDAATRARGLSDRDALGADGLLLEWRDAGRHPVWMQGMRFNLDLVWLDAADRVTGVVGAVPPCDRTPCPLIESPSSTPTRAVLELAAGRAHTLGLVPGAVLTRLDVPAPCISILSANPHAAEGGIR